MKDPKGRTVKAGHTSFSGQPQVAITRLKDLVDAVFGQPFVRRPVLMAPRNISSQYKGCPQCDQQKMCEHIADTTKEPTLRDGRQRIVPERAGFCCNRMDGSANRL